MDYIITKQSGTSGSQVEVFPGIGTQLHNEELLDGNDTEIRELLEKKANKRCVGQW